MFREQKLVYLIQFIRTDNIFKISYNLSCYSIYILLTNPLFRILRIRIYLPIYHFCEWERSNILKEEHV